MWKEGWEGSCAIGDRGGGQTRRMDTWDRDMRTSVFNMNKPEHVPCEKAWHSVLYALYTDVCQFSGSSLPGQVLLSIKKKKMFYGTPVQGWIPLSVKHLWFYSSLYWITSCMRRENALKQRNMMKNYILGWNQWNLAFKVYFKSTKETILILTWCILEVQNKLLIFWSTFILTILIL